MSIEYKVSVIIPDDLFSIYGDDKDFNVVLEDAIEYSLQGGAIDGMMYHALFDDIHKAEVCESKLIILFNEYDAKRDDIVKRINHVQECISSIIVDTTGKLDRILVQREELVISDSLSKYLNYESDSWLKLTTK